MTDSTAPAVPSATRGEFFPRISCPECEGRGWVKCPDSYCGTGSDFGWPHDTGCTAECEFCDGSGRIDPTSPGEMP
jgi:hypothetical protein